MDAWSGLFGAGISRAGQGVYISGTSEIVAIASAERIGAPYTVMIGGCVCVAGAIAFNIRLPGLRAHARQLIDAQHVATAGD